MKKAFTLIEMLGIIILLGLIGLIVYPTTIKVINDSKEELYQKNISELERLAISWASINEDKLPTVDKRGYYLKIEELKKDGFIDGEIKNPKTDEEMQGCVGIIYDETKDKHNYQYFEDCTNFQKPTLSNLKFSTLENEYGWRNQDFYVTLESEYLDSYEYCISDSKCNPNVKMNASDKILVNQEGVKYICVKGSNTVGDTKTECTLYRLDKTKPVVGSITFSGTKGLNDWYISDVVVTTTKSSDALSGIASDLLSPSATTITTDTSGTTYTLTAKDLAGNEASVSYSVKIDKTAPIVGTLNITGTKGDNDWYISNVNFTVNNGSDTLSGHTSTTTNINSITTDTTGTKVIVTTTDKAGNTSTQEYNIKVDKTAPTAGTITVNGTKGLNDWYTSDVTVNVINGSDATSGHASSTSNISSITSNTSGTTITITTKDNAGNTSTRTYSIKVDKTKPTLTAKSKTFEITVETNNSVSSYFNTPTYSISGGGSMSCNPTTTGSLSVGTHTLTCSATGYNGLTTTATTSLTVKEKTYAVTLKVNNGTGGSTKTITKGTNGTWTVSANAGYTLSGATFSPSSCGTLSGSTVTISNVTGQSTCTINMKWAVLAFKDRLLADNQTIKVRTDFENPFAETNTGTLYKATGDETETGGDVYYFAGNPENNWVKFGTYTSDFNVYNSTCRPYSYAANSTLCKANLSSGCTCSAVKYASKNDDIYWRIIRTNEDNSVRLLYVGPNPKTTTTAHIGMSPYNRSSTGVNGGTGVNNTVYVGYMYGSTGSLANNRKNTTSSTIKGVVDTWYKNYMNSNYGKYFSKTAIYCNDRSGDNYNSTKAMNYAGELRLDRADTATPSYKCGNNALRQQYSDANIADKFTVSTATGNGKLTYPVALITADEVTYAGGVGSWVIMNASSQLAVDADAEIWTMTPEKYKDASGYQDAYGFRIRTNTAGIEGRIWDTWIGGDCGVRPVLSIKSCVKVTQGNGSVDNPYILSIDSSCSSADN